MLIGDDDVVLSSPIILYDHPEVAPQSPGDLYDSPEIDEILALRVMTLTDEEKAEARGTDSRAAAIIDRCDDMSAETHGRPARADEAVGVARGPSNGVEELEDSNSSGASRPWRTRRPLVGPRGRCVVRPLDRVGVDRRRGGHEGQPPCGCAPSHRADAQDIFLSGLAATVAGVFTDVDGDQQSPSPSTTTRRPRS